MEVFITTDSQGTCNECGQVTHTQFSSIRTDDYHVCSSGECMMMTLVVIAKETIQRRRGR